MSSRWSAAGGAVAAALVLVGCALAYDLDGFVGADVPDSGAPAEASAPPDDAEAGSLPDDAEAGGPNDAEAGGPNDGGTDAQVPVDDAGCKGAAGPQMIKVGSFCIDATEVTRADYNAFLAAMGSTTSGQPAECAFNLTFAPEHTYASDFQQPATEIDWCDAFAYCKWAGKHLCGAIGGGPSSFDVSTAANDAWYTACSAGGSRVFPYGATYDRLACNGLEYDAGGGDTLPVASMPGCIGGYPGLRDMSGNAREWSLACEPGAGTGVENCRTRGGTANDPASELKCSDSHTDARSYSSRHVGFRCCSD